MHPYKTTVNAYSTTRIGIGIGAEWAADANGRKMVTVADNASAAKAAGVVEDCVQEGENLYRCSIVVDGLARIEVGATFTRGTHSGIFMLDAGGKAVPATAGNFALGRLILEDNAAIGAGGRSRCVISPLYVPA